MNVYQLKYNMKVCNKVNIETKNSFSVNKFANFEQFIQRNISFYCCWIQTSDPVIIDFINMVLYSKVKSLPISIFADNNEVVSD